jgi:transcriptional regulator with XRE-family HTH domain
MMHKLREARFYRRITQADLWLKTGIHFSTLSRIETGHVVPSAKQRRKLAKALKVPEAWLFPPESPNGPGKAADNPDFAERLPWEERGAASSEQKG